jgi:hypothetical protein
MGRRTGSEFESWSRKTILNGHSRWIASASAWGEVSAWALVRNAEVGFDRHASAQSRVRTLIGISDQRKAEASFEVSLAPGLPAQEAEIFLTRELGAMLRRCHPREPRRRTRSHRCNQP